MSLSIESLKPVRIAPATVALIVARGVLRKTWNVVGAWGNRRRLAALTALDDRMLADLGLIRGDLHAAVAEPLWRDPTTRLSVLAVERRAAERDYARWRRVKAAELDGGARPEPRRRAQESCPV